MTDDEKAIEKLSAAHTKLFIGKAQQIDMNIASDDMREYLGEDSKIYQSFSAIDISVKDGLVNERMSNAMTLLIAAMDRIRHAGIYKNPQIELMKLQTKDLKNKNKLLFWGAIGGAVLTNLKDIGKFLLKLLHL